MGVDCTHLFFKNTLPVDLEIKKKARLLKWFRKYHKWPGLIFALFILLFSVSGIVLNHRDLFSSVDVNRKWIPGGYHYKNWNLAAVKSTVTLPDDSLLIFGNIGIWKTDTNFTRFRDFNKGFPKGIDNRKIYSLLSTQNHRLLAGTLFGLYEYTEGWKKIILPVDEERIVKVLEKRDSLIVMTRSYILNANINDKVFKFSKIKVPAGIDSNNKVGLFRTLWVIHSGEIYGIAGKLLVDLVGLLFILITLSGIFYWFVPHLIKRVKESSKTGVRKVNRFSLKWHNRLGSWAIIILLLTTMTGVFLRPPLLIPIAYTEVTKIKYSKLDNPNPWTDKFRDLLYDDELKRYIVATSDGIYYSDNEFGSLLKKYEEQPPVSIMGLNDFEKLSKGEYLIGSFYGLFRWVPEKGIIQDNVTKLAFDPASLEGSPFGAVAVAGFIGTSEIHRYVFDYSGGAIPLGKSGKFPPMPDEIIKKSPISLWNLALEIHTGRIWEFLIGPFYILIVPLTGLAAILILITGFFAWYIPYRRKKKNNK